MRENRFVAGFIVYQQVFVHSVTIWNDPLVGRCSSDILNSNGKSTTLCAVPILRCRHRNVIPIVIGVRAATIAINNLYFMNSLLDCRPNRRKRRRKKGIPTNYCLNQTQSHLSKNWRLNQSVHQLCEAKKCFFDETYDFEVKSWTLKLFSIVSSWKL